MYAVDTVSSRSRRPPRAGKIVSYDLQDAAVQVPRLIEVLWQGIVDVLAWR